MVCPVPAVGTHNTLQTNSYKFLTNKKTLLNFKPHFKFCFVLFDSSSVLFSNKYLI